MIKNIIFDCSETLLSFHAIDYLASLVGDREKAVKMHYTLFRSEPWHRYDNGKLPENELESSLLPLLPEEDRETGRLYLREWINTYGVIEGAPQLLEDVRKAGLRTYLLSDFPPCFSVLWKKYEFLHHFDGRVVSCEVGYSKKDGVIYDILLEKYGLNGSECLFIDDVPKNVEIGEAQGIPGVVFTDMPSLRRELVSLGVLPR